ncbi:Ig-like domain-containing protein [Massilia sp. BJB1822]|uniref:Ig-like domain-containing protein n=1 Tax=Massilia sp. BJB1822 TaxID=2744470 RepID=UPI001E50599A|nr:Ig-like domain-containing protein [Massilia sp. BJB1822]
MTTMPKFKSLFLVPVLALLAACGGGGGGGNSTPSTPSGATLTSIVITPANFTMALGQTQTLTATGSYSDGKTAAITSGITWTLKGSSVAEAFSNGSVRGKAVGSETVTATVGTVTASTNFNVKLPYSGLVAGGNQTLVRKADGNLQGWGANNWGQLGDGSQIDRNTPGLVKNNTGLPWRMVVTGEFHTLAIRENGTLWAWGFNQNGQLGTGNTKDAMEPVQIGTATDWVFIAAGKSHSLAINKGNVLYGWGRNSNGQLGDGTVVDRLVPTKIGALFWRMVAAGATHTVGIRADATGTGTGAGSTGGTNYGSLYAWGGNASGQVGNGGTVDVLVPTQVGTLKWINVAAGASHTLAMRSDATLWGWGGNGNGQLGNGSSANASAPVQIGTDNDWATIAAGNNHSLAVRTNNTLWTWGANSENQLGDGTVNDYGAPQQVSSATTWTAVAAGAQHSLALRNDGSVWAWGTNKQGQLGNGNNLNLSAPTQILP